MSADQARLYCEAGPGVGLGHVARCLALAEALEEDGLRPLFVTGPEGQEALNWMAPDRFSAVLPSAVPDEICDVAVIDDYTADSERLQAVKRAARIVTVFDDLGGGGAGADIAIDTSSRAQKRPEIVVANPGPIVLRGPGFAPLRSAIHQRRAGALRARIGRGDRVDRVLVTAGGVDGRGFASVFLQGILAAQSAAHCRVDVVLGSQATSWPVVEALASRMEGRIHCYRDVPDITDLIAEADCSVGPGGVTLLEKLCLGLPSVAVVVADNQCEAAEGLAALGCVSALDARSCAPDDVSEKVRQSFDILSASRTARKKMWRRGAALVDGLGARRTVLAMRPEVDRTGRAVALRRFRIEDAETVLAWQSEPGMRRFFRNPDVPNPEDHRAWCAARLSDPFGVCEIIEAGGTPVGLVRLERHQAGTANSEPGEVSILLTASEQGKGTGTAALRALRRLLREEPMWAYIHPDNQASQRSFLRAGFHVAAEDRAEAVALADTTG